MGVALFRELRFFTVFQQFEGKNCRSHSLTFNFSQDVWVNRLFCGALEGSGHLWLCDDSRTCAAPLVSSKTLSSGCQSKDARVLCRCLIIESDSHTTPNRAFRLFWWEDRNHNNSFSHISGLFVFVLCDLLSLLYYSKSRWCEHLNTLRARHHYDPHKVKNTEDQSQTWSRGFLKRQSIDSPRKLQHNS